MATGPAAKRMYLSSPHMGEHEAAYVAEAFATNWVAPLGPHVERNGAHKVVATNRRAPAPAPLAV